MADEEEKEDKKGEDPLTDELADENGEGEEGEVNEEAGAKKKKLIMLVAIGVIALGGIVAGIVFSGILGPSKDELEEHNNLSSVPKIVYYDLEEFLVNLNNPGKQTSFLKMSVTLELPGINAKNMLDAKLPRIRDSFQVYLRELRKSDLQGSAGIQRLREELLLRINKILEPEKVNDILFKEIIVQ